MFTTFPPPTIEVKYHSSIAKVDAQHILILANSQMLYIQQYTSLAIHSASYS